MKKPSSFAPAKISSILTFSLLFSPMPSVAADLFLGKITDATQTAFIEGARVKIKELQISTTSDRKGHFHFARLAPGQYTLVIEYLGAAPQESKIIIDEGEMVEQLFVLASPANAEQRLVQPQTVQPQTVSFLACQITANSFI